MSLTWLCCAVCHYMCDGRNERALAERQESNICGDIVVYISVCCLLGLRVLHYAALKGGETTIEMLCLHGSAVNEPTLYDGNTALHLAAQYGHYSAVCSFVCLSNCLSVDWNTNSVLLRNSTSSVLLTRIFNPLIATLKLQSNEPSYSNTVIGTLAVDEWAVTFGTARRGLGGPNVTAHPSTASVPTSYYST